MTNLTKSEENYIKHEVEIRLHDARITGADRGIKELKRLLFIILGIGITSIIVPIVLHAYNLA